MCHDACVMTHVSWAVRCPTSPPHHHSLHSPSFSDHDTLVPDPPHSPFHQSFSPQPSDVPDPPPPPPAWPPSHSLPAHGTLMCEFVSKRSQRHMGVMEDKKFHAMVKQMKIHPNSTMGDKERLALIEIMAPFSYFRCKQVCVCGGGGTT